MNFTEFLIIFVNDMLDKVILLPYWLILRLRNRLYDKGLIKSAKADVPTICVGNVTAGGTGKTPHVEMILRMLQDNFKWGNSNIAVLSRGYKRTSRGFQQVTREGSAALFGDEPLQIKKKFPAVTVAVDKDRIEGADYLAHPEKFKESKQAAKCWNSDFPAADIIVLDDAYQYRKLKADLNIVLVDYNRPVTNDKLLPFGSLRDLPKRIYDADILIITKCPSDINDIEKEDFTRTLGFREFNSAEHSVTGKNGKKQTILFTSVHYESPQKVYSTSDSRYFYSKSLVMFSGIAKDAPLVNYLSDYYKIIRAFRFPDHHKFTSADINGILSAIKHNPTASLCTTEKDAQRILDYVEMPHMLMERMFYIPIFVDFITEEEKQAFDAVLLNLRTADAQL